MAQNAPPRHGPPTLTVKGRAMRIRTLGFLVLAGLAIWFIAVNTGSVSIRLWIPTVTLPLWVVLTVTLLVGILLGMFLSMRRRARR